MSPFAEIFERFKNITVLIVGDTMMDAYIHGRVRTISAEAPVPILMCRRRERRLGGAANVAQNIKCLGATPLLCGVVGKDKIGKQLVQNMQEENLSTDYVVSSEYRPTTIKTRILSDAHHLLRVDEEDITLLRAQEEEMLWKKVKQGIEKADLVLFQDYDKGTVTPSLIARTMQEAKKRNLPVTVDPKRRHFFRYKGATIFKPNLKELGDAMEEPHLVLETFDLEKVKNMARALQERIEAKQLLVTLSEHGILAMERGECFHFPTRARKIAEVSGAGDAVISVASLCTVLGESLEVLTQLSNLAGGLVCERPGITHIEENTLLEATQELLLS